MENKYFKIGREYRAALGSVLVVIAFALLFVISDHRIKTYSQTAFIMNTVFQISLDTSGDDPTVDLVNLGNTMEKESLSRRISTSEIAKINRSAGTTDGYLLSGDMEELLSRCFQLSEDTGGAFDITLGALISLWDIDSYAAGDKDEADFVPPSDGEIQKALEYCGYDKVRIDDHRIYMPKRMSLDLGSVGKGIYLSACKERIEKGTSGIISAGGSIMTVGQKKEASKWKVGITDPFGASDLFGTIAVGENLCVSTSGPYERFVMCDGIRYHHILDPRTGAPAEPGISSVTIVSDDGFISDALSTACFVLGEDKGIALARQYDADILIIRDDGTTAGTLTLD